MAIDLTTEKLISLKQAARLLPPGRNDRPVHVSTLVRAILKEGGLEALRVGGRWVTSAEALQRWAERQTAGTTGGLPTPPRRGKDAARVARTLDELGF